MHERARDDYVSSYIKYPETSTPCFQVVMPNIMALKHNGQNYFFYCIVDELTVLNTKAASVAIVEADVTVFISKTCDTVDWTVT